MSDLVGNPEDRFSHLSRTATDALMAFWKLWQRAIHLNHKVPNTIIAEFANTVDPDETAHHEPSYLDLQCLPSSL